MENKTQDNKGSCSTGMQQKTGSCGSEAKKTEHTGSCGSGKMEKTGSCGSSNDKKGSCG